MGPRSILQGVSDDAAAANRIHSFTETGPRLNILRNRELISTLAALSIRHWVVFCDVTLSPGSCARNCTPGRTSPVSLAHLQDARHIAGARADWRAEAAVTAIQCLSAAQRPSFNLIPAGTSAKLTELVFRDGWGDDVVLLLPISWTLLRGASECLPLCRRGQ